MFYENFVTIINNHVFRMIMLYLLYIIAHYVAAHLYVYYCVKSTFIGFLLSPFMTLAPHCQAFRWVIYNGGYAINMMWLLIGNWLINKFTLPTVDPNKKK
jgi:hypothetical protein